MIQDERVTSRPDGEPRHRQQDGATASSREFAHYDQVDKPVYQLAEIADSEDAFDDDFQFTTCDLRQYLEGSSAERADFVERLSSAMRDIGFTILTGHGIDTQLWVDAEDWIERLFCDHSLEEKLTYRAERHGAVSEGYFPIHKTSDIHPDKVEGWVFGRRAYHLDPTTSFEASEFWPDPELEPEFRQLVAAHVPLFKPVMSAILEGLGCDADLFDDKLTEPNFGQRLNYYPPLGDEDRSAGVGRLLGHEDVDLFTLLPAPREEGLQVLNRAGKWVRLDAPEGSIVLNTGDYLQRLSNDLLPSTTHRVSQPRDAGGGGRARFSLPLAAYLRPDEILQVLPNCGPPKYDPVSVIAFHTRATAKFYGDDYAVDA